MKTILIKEGCPNPISLGEKGENGVSAVLFDYSEWISDFGEGAISLLVKRKGDSSAYPVVLSTADGVATWTISDTDTAVQGYGKAEYIFTIDDKVEKSAVFSFFVAQDLGAAGDPPDPYESWIDTLTALGGETLVNAQRAETAQEAAETAQANAEEAEQTAEGHATAAAQSAGAARFAAESALASSDSASASATAASGHATAAEAAKDLAISAAESAQHSETQAELSASAAAESAESASGSATTATTAATNAAASATSASGSASAAATSAGQAAESAEKADIDLLKLLPTDSASGSIASFSDGADDVPIEALSVALEPVQDLHGQSSPYPAGGGKNKFDPSHWNTTITNYNIYPHGSTSDFTNGTKLTGGKTYTCTVEIPNLSNLTPWGIYGKYESDASTTVTFSANGSTLKRTFTLSSASDTRVIFWLYISSSNTWSGAGLTSVDQIKIQIEEGSTATDWSPYENLCPITGHTACEVWRSGVNLIDGDSADKSYGQCYTIGGEVINRTGYTVDLPSGTYTVSAHARVDAGAYIYMNVVSADDEFVSFWYLTANMDNRTATVTLSDGQKIIIYDAQATTASMADKLGYRYVQIETGSTATAYESPSIVHISIPLGQTVYGGTVDVVGGVLTVDRAMVDMGSLSWNYVSGSSFNLRSTTDIGALPPATTAITPNAISSIYQVLSYLGVADADKTMTIVFATSGQAGKVWVHDSSYTDATAFKTAVTGQQLVYELATPITIDLTPEQLTTLLGQNNVWSDSGDVSVTYRADIQKYIEKMIAEALT